MIISQTPLRISFFGGGTDFRDFYQKEPGMVLSTAIDKYIFVTIKERFDAKIRVGYTRTELVDSVDEVEHELVRECLRRTGITQGVEINTMADIPSEGSGLGSSSTLTVGLLHAMYMYRGTPKDHTILAREACEIEIDVLKKPNGVQDQYIAAFGGQRVLQFCPDDQVEVQSVTMEPTVARRLNQNLMLLYTNMPRKAESVLAEQRDNIEDRRTVLRQMGQMVSIGRAALETGALDDFGRLLNDAWQFKKQLASKVSNAYIDDLYGAALQAGALGGKITGAGGGGFLLLYCPREKQDAVRSALHHLPELPFHLERDGTKIIFNYRR
jgi:D-glycero-alpha-D-manno-heptose-7-phosphate kinase